MALKDLFLESLEDNPKWESFLDILEESNNRNVDIPIKKLRDMRDLSRNSDIDLIRESIQMLGINVTDTFESFAISNLAKILPQIATFHEVEGTPRFKAILEIILGVRVSVKPLYTSDYLEFYPEPLGELAISGGSWYLTSHVDLTFSDLDTIFSRSEITVNSSDFKYFEELGIRYPLFESLYLGNQLKAGDPVDLIRVLLADRLQELYYQFCPIEDVLQKLVFSKELDFGLTVSGKVAIRNKEYLTLSNTDIIDADLMPNKTAYSYQQLSSTATVVKSDGTKSSAPAQILKAEPNVVVVRGNKFQFEDISEDTQVSVTFRVLGKQFTSVFNVMPSGTPFIPDSIYIKGNSTMLDTDTSSYEVIAVIGGKHIPIPDKSNLEWSNENSLNTLVDSSLSSVYTHEDILDRVQVTYTSISGEVFEAGKAVLIRPSYKDVVPKKIEVYLNDTLVEGSMTISQGVEHSIHSVVTYSDDSEQVLIPKYSLYTKKAKIIDSAKVFCEAIASDFVATLKAEFQDSVAVETSVDIKFEYPKYEICKLTIVAPSKLNEGDRVRLACNVHWCKGEDLDAYNSGAKTLSEVEVYVSETSPIWSLGKTNGSDTADVVGEFYDDGLFEAPEVSRTELAIVKASTKTVSGRSISTSATINIIPEERRINYIDTLVAKSVVKGSRVPITFVANWNDGQEKTLQLDSPDYDLSVSISVNGSPSESLSMEGNLLIFDGSISGIAEVTSTLIYNYTTVDGDSLSIEYSDTALVSLVKDVTRLDSMTITCPTSRVISDGDEPTWYMQETSRMFINTNVRYENGKTEGVVAKWKIESVQGDGADSATILSSEFPIRDMIPILTGKTPEELYIERLKSFYDIRSEVRFNDLTGDVSYDIDGSLHQYNISDATDLNILYTDPILGDYTEFSSLRTFADLDEVKSRALIQTRHVNNDTLLKVTCTYFTQEESAYIKIVDAVAKPVNTINSSRLVGPREFYANYESVSYALAIDFDDGGEEYEVSSDWEIDIINKAEVMVSSGVFSQDEVLGKTREELDQMADNTTFVDIDEDGDVYCKFNINMRLEVTAYYLETGLEFSKSMEVNAIRGNTQITGAEILGPVGVVDLNDPNLIDDGGHPYIQYTGVITKSDSGSERLKVDGIWGIELSPSNQEDVSIQGININETTGQLYLDEQINSVDVVITFEYTEDFTHVSETIKARMPLKVHASRAIDKLDIAEVSDIVYDGSMLQLNAEYTLLDGSTHNLMSDEGEWYLIEGPDGTTVSQTGVVDIPKLSDDDYFIVSAKLSKGNITLEDSILVNISARNALDRIEIVGHSYVRDNSTVTFESVAFRQFNAGTTINVNDPCSQECVTALSIWSISGTDGQPIDNVSMNPTTGELTIGSLKGETKAVVYVEYLESGQEIVRNSHDITLVGSYPRYGSAPYGLNTQEKLRLLEYTVENPLRGQFGINVLRKDGINNYGYLAVKKSSGYAEIRSLDGKGDFGGWQGANWPASAFPRTPEELAQIIADNGEDPVEVTMDYDNTSDVWLVYRTNLPNCGSTIFSFYTKST